MDEFKKLLHSAAGKVSKVLVIISALLIFLIFSSYGESFMSTETANTINNILIGIATGLIGIVVTVSFVQYAFDKQDEEKKRMEEILTIKRYDKYMETLIRRFLMYYISVTTRLKNREKVDLDDVFNYQPKFSDIADMYLTSMYLSEGFLESSVTLFFRSEEKLREYMLRMIESIDFKYNAHIEKILLDFVTKSVDLDMRGNILGATSTKLGKNKMLSEYVSEQISNEAYNWTEKFQRGELNGNLMFPYVLFYYTIQDQVGLLKKYTDYIKNLDCT